jgi:hypothetical protein
LPKTIAPDNKYSFGLVFWAPDYANFWMTMLTSDGTVTLFAKANNIWQTITSAPTAAAFKPEPDAVNVLRVTTIAGKISIYLNGQLQKRSEPKPRMGVRVSACTPRSTRAWTEPRQYS